MTTSPPFRETKDTSIASSEWGGEARGVLMCCRDSVLLLHLPGSVGLGRNPLTLIPTLIPKNPSYLQGPADSGTAFE